MVALPGRGCSINTLHQKFLPSTEWDVRILASDVHVDALEFGQNAEYTKETLQNVSKENKLSYFEKIGQVIVSLNL